MNTMTPAPITARGYYRALLTVVDAVEQDCVANVRQRLQRELESLERLSLADDVWTPTDGAPVKSTAMTLDDASPSRISSNTTPR